MAEYTFRSRLEKLKKYYSDLPEQLSQISENATMRAVEKAAELTPPTKDDLSGTNTRAGEMKQHWAADSTTKPQRKGNSYETRLANNMKYASYVNDGHNNHWPPIFCPYSRASRSCRIQRSRYY